MIPLSILDLAPISAGSDAATALRNTIDLAQHAERWGFHRFWIAEHHFVGVASSAPAVLIGQIAAATNRIRVGAAAVQLGHTTAAAVVESFGMLEAFHPGRIDLGVGRGQRRDTGFKPKQPSARTRPPRQWREVDGVVIPLPFDLRGLLDTERVQATMGILQQPEAVSPDFAEQLADILAMLDGTYEAEGFDVHAVPGERSGLTPWVFGSTRGQSARVAGARGLPFVASYHITPATALEAIEAYRDTFVPSAALKRPYVVVSADIVVADDSATAKHLATGYGQWVYSIRTGVGAMRYPDPDDCPPLTDEQMPVVNDRLETQFVGDPDEVAERLSALQRLTDADELVVTSVTHRHEDRLRSHRADRAKMGADPLTRKPIHLAAHFPGVNNTTVWTDPGAGSQIEFDSFVHLARTAERGLFDFFFLAEGLRLREHRGRIYDLDVVGRPDTFTVLAALAGVTDRIGLTGTINTTFNEPFEVARQFATLDHLSDGRAGWNIVTSSDAFTGANFRRGGFLEHADRYLRAEEFLAVAQKFWDSWAADAVLADIESGTYVDPERIRSVEFSGAQFDVRGVRDTARRAAGSSNSVAGRRLSRGPGFRRPPRRRPVHPARVAGGRPALLCRRQGPGEVLRSRS